MGTTEGSQRDSPSGAPLRLYLVAMWGLPGRALGDLPKGPSESFRGPFQTISGKGLGQQKYDMNKPNKWTGKYR